MTIANISTVGNDPRKLWRWSEIAIEETVNSTL